MHVLPEPQDPLTSDRLAALEPEATSLPPDNGLPDQIDHCVLPISAADTLIKKSVKSMAVTTHDFDPAGTLKLSKTVQKAPPLFPHVFGPVSQTVFTGEVEMAPFDHRVAACTPPLFSQISVSAVPI